MVCAARLSVSQSVCLSVNSCSHACCGCCKQWKCITEEEWKRHEVENTRRGMSSLICKACCRVGRTKRSSGLRDCAACKTSLGRATFDGKDLNNQQQKEKTKTPYTLVCKSCKEREERIMGTIDALEADTCRSSCSSTWRHSPTCRTIKKTKLRISETDLKWLQFRSKHRASLCVTEISYYRDCGVLIP